MKFWAYRLSTSLPGKIFFEVGFVCIWYYLFASLTDHLLYLLCDCKHLKAPYVNIQRLHMNLTKMMTTEVIVKHLPSICEFICNSNQKLCWPCCLTCWGDWRQKHGETLDRILMIALILLLQTAASLYTVQNSILLGICLFASICGDCTSLQLHPSHSSDGGRPGASTAHRAVLHYLAGSACCHSPSPSWPELPTRQVVPVHCAADRHVSIITIGKKAGFLRRG